MSEPMTDAEHELESLIAAGSYDGKFTCDQVRERLRELRALCLLRDRLRSMFQQIKPEDPDDTLFDAIEDMDIERTLAVKERDELRAWRAKLGDPKDWMPSINYARRCAIPSGGSCYGARCKLLTEARALVERAKDGP